MVRSCKVVKKFRAGLVNLLLKGAGTPGVEAAITLDILRCSVIFPDLRFGLNFTLVCCFVLERYQLPQFALAPDPLMLPKNYIEGIKVSIK